MDSSTGIGMWTPVNIEQRQCVLWSFPPCRLYVQRVENEWHVLTAPGPGEEAEAFRSLIGSAEKPDPTAWRHYLRKENETLQPVPVLPDRPVVIRPDRSLTLLRGESALFFLRVPVWFRLRTEGPRPATVFETPLTVLSNTWFGDPINGELCYALATRIFQKLEAAPPSACHAVCPLLVSNDSDTDLPFERICLHVENVNVYRGENRLWTNQIDVAFRGADQSSQIAIGKAAPGYDGPLSLAGPARQPAEGGYMRRTFGMLKYFTGI